MLSRKLRLSRAQFAPALAGKRAISAHFSVTIRKTEHSGGCAAVISKKTAKKAVERHLLKRRILAAVKPWCSPEYSVVVFARAGSPTLSYKDLTHELHTLIAGVIGTPRASR